MTFMKKEFIFLLMYICILYNDIYIYIYIYMYISRNMNSFFINVMHLGCQTKRINIQLTQIRHVRPYKWAVEEGR